MEMQGDSGRYTTSNIHEKTQGLDTHRAVREWETGGRQLGLIGHNKTREAKRETLTRDTALQNKTGNTLNNSKHANLTQNIGT